MSQLTTTPDTIFALATAPGRAALAVVRVSGPLAGKALTLLSRRQSHRPRCASLVQLHAPDSSRYRGDLLDQALVLWFPAPHSYTGENVAEFHLHGGRAVIAGVLEALASIAGLRPADPGEFTRRAFDHGRLDLTEAEAIADLIDAETAAQRKQALRQLDGGLGRLYDGWRERLLQQLAYTEAHLDFPDDEIPPDILTGVQGAVAELVDEMSDHLNDSSRGLRLREGLSVAIIGPPNAGKSSLLNLVTRREAAIVSPRSGTTRDVIEVNLEIGGYQITLADTAGLRECQDEIESEGVRRATEQAKHADYRIAVFDGALWPALDPVTLSLVDDNTLVIVNKRDLHGLAELPLPGSDKLALGLSVLTGAGFVPFMARLTAEIGKRLEIGAQPSATRPRHRHAVTSCHEALCRAQKTELPELYAEDLRLAVRALGQVTGRVEVSELLDIIFRDFCIGK